MAYPAAQSILNYSTTNVTTSAYTEVVHSLSSSFGKIEVLDTSGKIVKIAFGAAGSEVDYCTCPVSGSIVIPLSFIAQGTRVSIKAVDANATSGYNIISFLPS